MFVKFLDLFKKSKPCNVAGAYQKQPRTTIGEYGNNLYDEKMPGNPVSGEYEVTVVGVFFYQKALERICEGRREEGMELHVTAQIIPYDDNPADVHAVRIEIEGEIVGHLSRKQALVCRSKMISDGFSGAVACPAKIAWDRNFDKAGSYGVWLNIDLTLPNSVPESHSANNSIVPNNQSSQVDFLVNQLNSFELLNCRVGDAVSLWQKGDSKEIYIYRQGTDFGQGKIGICPDAVCDVLLSAARWNASIASIYEGGCKIVCNIISKAEMGKNEEQGEVIDNDLPDYIEPSEEEVSREMEKWMFVCKQKPDVLQVSDKWFHDAVHKAGICRESYEFALRWMKPFVSSSDFEREEVRILAVNGLCWSQIIMKELRKVIRQARKETANYDETLRSLYGLAIAASLSDDLCNSLPSGYNNSTCEYVAYREIEEIELDYTKIGYNNLKALGKTDIKWLVERFGEPAEHTMTKDIYSEIIATAVTRYIWDRCEDKNRNYEIYGNQTIEKCLKDEIKSGFYVKYLKSNH